MRHYLVIFGFCLLAALFLVELFFAPAGRIAARSSAQGAIVVTPAIPYYWTETFETVQTVDLASNLAVDPAAGQLHLALRDAIAQQTAAVAKGPNQELYVVWQDRRNDDGDIYAQRLNVNGQRLWPNDVRINSDNGRAIQSASAATTDGLGNLVVAWADRRNGHNEIYGQRLDADGHQQWPEDRRFHADAGSADHDQPALARLANGALVVAWHDNRTGDYNIYAQQIRVDDGSRLWASDLQVYSAVDGTAQSNPTIATNGGDETAIAWLDQRNGNGDIYAQQISAQGTLLWATESQLNTVSIAGTGRPALAANGDGWIAAWLGANDGAIYAQHLSATGQTTWAINPKVTGSHSQADPESAPLVAGLPAGEALIAWVDAQDGALYSQRLTTDGRWRWSVARQLNRYSSKHVNCHHPVAVSLNDQKVLLAWADDQSDEQLDIYSQLVDGDGVPTWGGEQSINTRLGMVTQSTAAVAVAPDGGSVLAWRDDRRATPAIFLQRLDAVGNALWSDQIIVDGQMVSATAQLVPSLALAGNDTLVTWSDERSGRGRVYLQRFDAHGFRQWNAPVAVSLVADEAILQFNPVVRANNQGQIFVGWEELLNNNRRVAVQQFDSAGNRQWPADLIAPATGDARSPALAVNGNDLALVWLGGQLPETDLYMDRLDPTGKFLWSSPVRVNRFSGLVDQFNPPAVAVSDDGDALAVWVDKRNYDLYAQRIDKSGGAVWATDLRLNEAPGTVLLAPDVTTLPGGDALFVWQGVNNSEFTIIGQRIDKFGQRLWASGAAGGLVVSNTARQAQRPKIASDASGSALVVWSEQRRQNGDIFSQRLNNQGSPLWRSDLPGLATDHFYVQQGFARSKKVPTLGDAISEATLTADVTRNGGQIGFWLSNDGGLHWAAVEPNVRHIFTTTGADLRWQITLQADSLNPTQSPLVHRLELVYAPNIVAQADAHEPDNTCLQAHPLQLDAAPQQRALAATASSDVDEDWIRLNVQPNVSSELLVRPGAHSAALRLEGYQDCAAQTASIAVSAEDPLHLSFQSTGDTFFARVAPVSSTLAANIPYTISVRQANPVGLAILVAGGLLAADSHQPQVDQAVAGAYRTLLAHGYHPQQIFYLSHDLTQDADGDGIADVDGLANLANLQNTIEQWTLEQWHAQTDQRPVRVLLNLVGHGDQNGFYTADSTFVNARTLDRWLSNLETTGHVEQITTIVDTNAAGFLLDGAKLTTHNDITKTLAGPNRIVVASTTATRLAWPTSQGMLFSDALWTALAQGYSLAQSFVLAQQTVDSSGYGCVGATVLCQSPRLADGRDLGDAAGLSLADGWSLPAPYLDQGPIIDAGQINWQPGNSSTEIEVTVRGADHGGRVEAQIFPPDFVISAPTPGHLPALTGQLVTLNQIGTVDKQQPPAAHYAGLFGGFTQAGVYRIVIYAWDAQARSALPYELFFTTEQRLFLPLIAK